MSYFNKPPDEITPADIIALRDDRVMEGHRLEYKQELPGTSHEARKDFYADVSSLANTTGGTILYGVKEKRTHGSKKLGYPSSFPGVGSFTDNDRTRLENMLGDNLNPRVRGLRVHAVKVRGRNVVCLHVPLSLSAPHAVWYRRDSKFWARHSGGKYQMTVREIGDAFMHRASWIERSEQFRHTRIEGLRSGSSKLVGLQLSSAYVMHLLPLGYSEGRLTVQDHEEHMSRVEFYPGHGVGCARYNFDGLAIVDQPRKVHSYAQLFRNGNLELLHNLAIDEIERVKSEYIPTNWLDKELVNATGTLFRLASGLPVAPPFSLSFSLLGIGSYALIDNPPYYDEKSQVESKMFDRNDLHFPAVLLESIPDSHYEIAEPLLDMIWQSAGWKECMHKEEYRREYLN